MRVRVKRQVKAPRFARIAQWLAVAATITACASEAVPVAFWLAAFLFAIMLACALVSLFFVFTEQPTEEVVMYPTSGKGLIHFGRKEEKP